MISDTNMVMLENLLLYTRYYIYVRSRCNDTVYSDWTEVYIAETEKCVSPCLFTIEMFDSYGDGWNGNEISIVQNGNVIDVATFTDGSESEMSFTVCPDSIDFIFKTGRYLEEISFKIYDTNGALSYQCYDATRFYNA